MTQNLKLESGSTLLLPPHPQLEQLEKKTEGTWNRWTVNLSPETKSALKIAGLVLGMVVAGCVVGAAFFLPFTWPVAPILVTSGCVFIIGSGKQLGTEVYVLYQEKEATKRIANGLADPIFFCLLFGLNKAGDAPAFARVPIQTIANFFKERGISGRFVGELEQAAARAKRIEEESSDPSTEAKNIRTGLDRNENQLLACSKKTKNGRHAFGLRFSKDPNSNRVICSIFNSGSGIKEHEQLSNKRFDLEYRISIPDEALTEEIIESFLVLSGTVEELYKSVSSLHGAKRIFLTDKENGRLQIVQKAGNCSIEWIFAYLNYEMEEYYEMRHQIFTEAYELGSKHPETRAIIEEYPETINNKLLKKEARSNNSDKAIERRNHLTEMFKLSYLKQEGYVEQYNTLLTTVNELKQEIYDGLPKKG